MGGSCQLDLAYLETCWMNRVVWEYEGGMG